MMRLVILVGLAAAALADDETKEKPKEIPPLLRLDPAIRLPKSTTAVLDRFGDKSRRVVANLDAYRAAEREALRAKVLPYPEPE